MERMRHEPSAVLWQFCWDRFRELRPEAREREMANVLGFEHSRAVRWKTGMMYVDRAEYLFALADALSLDPLLLANVASGRLTAEQAKRAIKKGLSGKAFTPTAPEKAERHQPLVALVGGGRESAEMRLRLVLNNTKAVDDNPLAEIPSALPMLLMEPSEAFARVAQEGPDAVFVELACYGTFAVGACRAFSRCVSGLGHRVRVIAGVDNVPDGLEQAVVGAGAAKLVKLPFNLKAELEVLGDRFSGKSNGSKRRASEARV